MILSKLNIIQRPKSSFWVFNITGWLLMSAVNITFQTQYFTTNFEAFQYSFIVTGIGFSFSILNRYIILKLNVISKKIPVLFSILFVSTLLLSIITVTLFTLIILALYPTNEYSLENLVKNLFNFSTLFFIWTLIYTSYLFIKHQQLLAKQQLQLSLDLKEAELNNLRKQLSPHFLFNSINNIRSLILINPENARESLLNISDLLRYALSYQKKNSVTIEEEMEIVTAYINLNKLHLGKNVNFEVNVDSNLLDFKIPPMSVQLLVENAIKHGKILNGTIRISIKSENSSTLIIVTNPGNLMPNSENGIGLSYLKQRLNSNYFEKAKFSIIETNSIVKAQILIK